MLDFMEVTSAAPARETARSMDDQCYWHYAAFGGVLRSAIKLPELDRLDAFSRPDWTLRVEPGMPPAVNAVPMGRREVRDEWYRLSRLADGIRLEYSHAGTFDIVSNGSVIIWYRNDDAVPELVRNIVLGPAIAVAMELAGLLCLHGSAVACYGNAIAFIGPKYFGKSTLASALTTAGCQLIGDDLLVVQPGRPPRLLPGVPSVRLWPDIVKAIPIHNVCDTLLSGIKTTATSFAREAVALDHCPLEAVYVLSPVAPDSGGGAVRREPLSTLEATISFAHQTKLPDSLVGLETTASRLAKFAALAATVPVYRLSVLRDLTKLNESVQQIIDWSTK